MPSEVDIVNRALRAIGSQRITSLDEATEQAETCRGEYADIRDEVLRSHPWNFAMTRLLLPALSDAPAFGWERQFQLPSDCLRVWRIDAEWRITEFRVESGRILTNAAAPLALLYIRRPQPGDFDPIFVSALVHRLAAALALSLKESASASELQMKLYRAIMRDARAADATEGTPEQPWQDDFIVARY